MSAPGESFPVTRLSVVAAARSTDAAERSLALEILFSAYWKPIYKYLRLKYAQAPQDAQDLTQGFFAELLERGLLAKFDAAKSRLRTYLRLCADSFALNEIKAASRKKRGGDVTHVALDFSAAEEELRSQAKIFSRKSGFAACSLPPSRNCENSLRREESKKPFLCLRHTTSTVNKRFRMRVWRHNTTCPSRT